MTLIDADALRQDMYHEAFETDSEMQKWDSGCWIRYKMFENAIKNFPTVDAPPVVHGKWVKKEKVFEDGTTYVCSNCGERPTRQYNVMLLSDYCPWCGAKMDAFANDINVSCKSDEVTE